jgi:hypothetical protein
MHRRISSTIWIAGATSLLLAAAPGCDRSPGEFKLEEFKRNVSERLDEVERQVKVLERTGGKGAVPTTSDGQTRKQWLRQVKQELHRARELLASIEIFVEERGYEPRAELLERTRELEKDVGPVDPGRAQVASPSPPR